jgi:Uma2 family endonuclease
MVKEEFIDGPPDMVMEVVSPDSQVRDWHDKYIAYETSGVREYWVIDPGAMRVEAYVRGRGGKYSRIKETDGCIRSKVLGKLFIRPQWLWQSPLLKMATVLKELGLRG